MSVNRGKDFEVVIKSALENVPGCTVDRLHDQTSGFKGSYNICDFIAYKYPNIYYLECKSCHKNTFPFSNLTDNQRLGMLEKSKTEGVVAGVIIWWQDHDVTKFVPIQDIIDLQVKGKLSLRYDADIGILIPGKKKRIFFDYDLTCIFER